MQTKRLLIFLLLFPFCFAACRHQENPEPQKANPIVEINIRHAYGDQDFALYQPYLLPSGLAVELSKLQYYVSNVQLRRKDGSWWKQPESYHLVQVEESGEPSFKISLGDLPAGEYTEMRLGLGVDAIRNHQGAQTGALDPLNGMLWTWESGYVFFKAEGFYETSQQRQALVMHVGRDDCYREVTLPLPVASQAFRPGENIALHLTADLKKVYGGHPGASFTLSPPANGGAISIMGNPEANLLSQNYATMLSLKEVVARVQL